MTLKEMRINLGWTQEALAEKAGLNWSVVRQAETGKPIRATSAKALADVLSTAYGTPIRPTDLEKLNVQ
jgi:DNA-binding XRE family transcriptional regulator